MWLPLLLDSSGENHPFLLFQSTAAQSILPVLRKLITRSSSHTLVFALLYDPQTLAGGGLSKVSTVQVYDWTTKVPGYAQRHNIKAELLSAVESVPSNEPLNMIIDSLEILSENLLSTIEAYELLQEMLQHIKKHPQPSQLIVHSVKPSGQAILLLQTNFSPSLVHLTAHPTSLFRHLSEEYMLPPPPAAPDTKFWGVFIPFSERTHEVERLSFGLRAEGSGSGSEMIIEILLRGTSGQSRKRGVERVLEGWSTLRESPCPLSELQDIKSLFIRRHTAEATPDPTQDLSFDLNLSASQQLSRAQVPLPYTHEGRQLDSTGPRSGTIFYEPDSADDIDADDPDDDLDI